MTSFGQFFTDYETTLARTVEGPPMFISTTANKVIGKYKPETVSRVSLAYQLDYKAYQYARGRNKELE